MTNLVHETNVPLSILAPASLFPSSPHPISCTTPYGTTIVHTTGGQHWLAPAWPQALIYTSKEMGLARVVELLPLHALNRLAEPGDLVFPDQLLDLTSGPPATFFVGKGYGFIQQNPPFCPELRAALLAAARETVATRPLLRRPRVFGRGTYGAMDEDALGACMRETGTEAATEREGKMERNLPPGKWDARLDGSNVDANVDETVLQVLQSLQFWGADVVGVGSGPVCFLSRELELCYAPLGYVVAGDNMVEGETTTETALLLQEIVSSVQQTLSAVRSCACQHTMRSARERGRVGDDWHSWIVE
jgi:5'-methylthioadenosine phosphorylase